VTREPETLDAAGCSKWRELWPILERRGAVDAGTADALTVYCAAWSRWLDAEKRLQADGAVLDSPPGKPMAHPAVSIAAQAQRQLRQWAAVLRIDRTTEAEDEHNAGLLRLMRGDPEEVTREAANG